MGRIAVGARRTFGLEEAKKLLLTRYRYRQAVLVIDALLRAKDKDTAKWIIEQKIGKPTQQMNVDTDYFAQGQKFLEELKRMQAEALAKQGEALALPAPEPEQAATPPGDILPDRTLKPEPDRTLDDSVVEGRKCIDLRREI